MIKKLKVHNVVNNEINTRAYATQQQRVYVTT